MLARVPRKANHLRFHKLFDLPDTEELDDVISCVVGQHVPPRLGNLYITAAHLCFHCGLLTAKFKRVMPWDSIQDITPEASGIHKNIVIIHDTPEGSERLVFWAFKNRNRSLRVLLNHWNGVTGRQSSFTDMSQLDKDDSNEATMSSSSTVTTSPSAPRSAEEDEMERPTQPAEEEVESDLAGPEESPVSHHREEIPSYVQVLDAQSTDLTGTMAFFSVLASGAEEAERRRKIVEEKERTDKEFCGLLHITIVQAKELPISLNGKPSPYCTIEFGRQSQDQLCLSTKVLFKSITPAWKEQVTIPCKYADVSKELVFTVYDSQLEKGNSLTKDSTQGAKLMIGKAKTPVRKYLSHKLGYTLRGLPRHDKWLNLDTSKSEGFRLENLKYCKLRIQTEFIGRQALILGFWRECAKLFSVDGSGNINRLEMFALLDALGMSNLTDDEVEDLFATIDLDGDGNLSPEEIALYMEQKDNSLTAVTKCPACRVDLTGHGDFIFHLASCFHRNSSHFRDSLMSGMLSPIGALKGIASYVTFSGGKKTLLVVDRETGHLIEEKIPMYIRTSLNLMYNTRAAKAVGSKKAQRILQHMTVSSGRRADSPSSKKEILPFIEFHGLKPQDFLEDVDSFECFNQFFYRKLKPGIRPLASPNDPRVAVSPADCRCVVFPSIASATELWIKGRSFNLETLLCDIELVKQYQGCSVGIFRLAPQDYHRFHIPVDGVIGPSMAVDGAYYTVNPVAINNSINVYGENKRVITQIDSPHFGKVLYITIGATMVGSIVLTTEEGESVKRGDEHGYFAFGGSTILLLFEQGRIRWDDDLSEHSSKPVETLIRMGSPIGRAVS